MSEHEEKGSRNVRIGGNAIGNAIVTGDASVGTACYQEAVVSTQAEIVEALKKIRAILEPMEMEPRLRKRVQNALEEAEEEVATADPDKEAVGSALDRLLQTAEKTGKLAETAEKLRPHVAAVAAWLGPHWHRLVSWISSAL